MQASLGAIYIVQITVHKNCTCLIIHFVTQFVIVKSLILKKNNEMYHVMFIVGEEPK